MAARYDWFGEEGMKRDDEGFYVRHEDYAQELADAQAEIARLRGALTAAANYIDTLGGVSTSYRQS